MRLTVQISGKSLENGKLLFLSSVKSSQSLDNANWKTLKTGNAQLSNLCIHSAVCGMSVLSLNCLFHALSLLTVIIQSSLCDMLDLMPLLGITAHSRYLNYSSMTASVILLCLFFFF